LLSELEAKRIRYRHGAPIYRGWVFPLSYVWARLGGLVAHEITPSNAVIRKGPALVRGELVLELPSLFERDNEPDETERYVADPRGSTTVVEVPLVQLHRDDILRRLQARGFMPLQHELPLSSPTPNEPLATQDAAAPEPAPISLRRKSPNRYPLRRRRVIRPLQQ
jgi:hypothetical protein